jgi:hypothetical protein
MLDVLSAFHPQLPQVKDGTERDAWMNSEEAKVVSEEVRHTLPQAAQQPATSVTMASASNSDAQCHVCMHVSSGAQEDR